MKKRILLIQCKEVAPRPLAGAAHGTERNTNLLLLISNDAPLGRCLRDAAEQMGLLFARSAPGSSLLWQLRALRPGVVVLDFDQGSETDWETADRLLELESCPPLFLLTSRKIQLGDATVVQTGPIGDQPPGPARLLRLAEPVSTRSIGGQWNSTQRIHVQWCQPCSWSVQITSANGFCRTNE